MNKSEKEIEELFRTAKLPFGRMISGSKSGYYSQYPEHLIVFNASVLDKDGNHIWRGDLDLDFDAHKLEDVAKELNIQLFVVKEFDVVWTELKGKDLVAKHVWKSGVKEEKKKTFFQKILEKLKLS